MMKFFLIVLSAALLAPNCIDRDLNASAYYTPPYDGKEKYDPRLSYLNSIEKLQQYIDEQATREQVQVGSVAYITLVEDAIEKRFYHGFSHLSTAENWVAAVGEKLLGYGLSCKVQPEDILQHGNAACSQQCIVMMEILKSKNIAYRKIGFPHHYALEAQVAGKWYYFDPNMEPVMTAAERNEVAWNHQADLLKPYYDNTRFKDLDYKFGKGETVLTGSINENPARNLKMFHAATMVLSRGAFLLPLLLLLVLAGSRRHASAAHGNRLTAMRSFIGHVLRRRHNPALS